MSDYKKIAAFSVVKNNTVSKNAEQLFEADKNINADEFLLAAYQHLAINYPKFYKMDNLCKLGIIATEVLLKDETKVEDAFATGIILSNSNASLDSDIKYYDSVANIPSPALFVYTLPNIVIGEISIKHSFKGENAFFIFDSFDAAFTTHYVNNLFATTQMQRCICGWVDLLKNDYEAVLFLIEKSSTINEEASFTENNLNNIYLKHTWKKHN